MTQYRPGQSPPTVSTASRGMTLIELMVAVALLSIMILCFGKIVAESRKLVGVSQATMRANNMAMAIDQSLRDDIRRASQFGFLYIGVNPRPVSGSNPAILICGSVGPSQSVTANASTISNCKVVAYSLCPTLPASSTGILWKAGFVLTGTSAPTTTSDTWGNLDQYQLQVSTTNAIKTNVVDMIAPAFGGYQPANLPASPDTLTAVLESWKYMATNCTEMEIAWTDGTASATPGALKWYPHTTSMIWTKDKDDNGVWPYGVWPKAVRVRFTITDPGMPAGLASTGNKYEVICPVSR